MLILCSLNVDICANHLGVKHFIGLYYLFFTSIYIAQRYTDAVIINSFWTCNSFISINHKLDTLLRTLGNNGFRVTLLATWYWSEYSRIRFWKWCTIKVWNLLTMPVLTEVSLLGYFNHTSKSRNGIHKESINKFLPKLALKFRSQNG